MTDDSSNTDKKLAQMSDISPQLGTIQLNDGAATSLHATAHDLETHGPSELNQPEKIVLEAHPPRNGHFSKWLQWWPAVVFPPTYALHRYYRRHRPRRLPTLTPLKLPGLYVLAFTSTVFSMQQMIMYAEMVLDDKRLYIIECAGDRAAATSDDSPEVQEALQSMNVKSGLAQVFKRIRDESYYSSGIAGKLAWWDYHIWSDQKTFNRWMHLLLACLDKEQSIAALPREDLEICATHLANRSSQRVRQISRALEWSMGFSVPLAMLARWSGRRAMYLPMNGLQRLLLGAWMYVELPFTFRELWYLQRIREKDVASRVMVDLFGSFHEEFEEIGIDYDDAPPDAS